MWFIELGLHADFNLKRGRFFTKAIFTGSTASTVHNSMKIMFQNFTFGVIQAMIHGHTCLSVLSIPFLE